MLKSITDLPLNLWLFRGAMLCVVKSKRKDKHAEALTQDYIITRKFPSVSYLRTRSEFREPGCVDTSCKS